MLFAATNRGGQAHLTGELFRDKSKANMSFVHAAGGAVSLNDGIAGRIPIMFEGLAGLAPGVQNGGIRMLGVAAIKRLPNVPNLPAINETVPGVVSSGWIVMMAPVGVPDAVIQKVNSDLRKVVAMPDVVEKMHTLGTYSRDLTPAQTGEFIESEQKLWWPVVRGVHWASVSYYRARVGVGIRVFEFEHCFSHTKAFVLDDYLTIIGSANADVRSFRLNFELACFVDSTDLNGAVAEILRADIRASREVTI